MRLVTPKMLRTATGTTIGVVGIVSISTVMFWHHYVLPQAAQVARLVNDGAVCL